MVISRGRFRGSFVGRLRWSALVGGPSGGHLCGHKSEVSAKLFLGVFPLAVTVGSDRRT